MKLRIQVSGARAGFELKVLAANTTDGVVVSIDFQWVLPPSEEGVTIQIWHTTDDFCGPSCTQVQNFMNDVIKMAEFLDSSNPITVEPRFVFTNCTSNDEGVDHSCSSCSVSAQQMDSNYHNRSMLSGFPELPCNVMTSVASATCGGLLSQDTVSVLLRV